MEIRNSHYWAKVLATTVVSALVVGYGLIGPVLHAMVEPVIADAGTYAVAASSDTNQWILAADTSTPIASDVSGPVALLELQ